MTWQTAFPEFPAVDMPTIPADWSDVSWRNDACPCFVTPNGLSIWIDTANPEERLTEVMEDGDTPPRFVAYTCDTDGAFTNDMPVLETEEWATVLQFVGAYTEALPLAEAFTKVLREWLTPEQFTAMRAMNVDHRNDSICASHDFVDSNMAMFEAFTATFGRDHDLENARDNDIWNVAWEIAKRLNLTGLDPLWTVGTFHEYENGQQAEVVGVSKKDSSLAIVRKGDRYELAQRTREQQAERNTWSNPDEDEADFGSLDEAISGLAAFIARTPGGILARASGWIVIQVNLHTSTVGPFPTAEAAEAWLAADLAAHGDVDDRTVWPLYAPDVATAIAKGA